MKRVYNNLILTENKAIRYTSVPNEPIKGMKRKADSTDLDEALKRSTTPLVEIDHKLRLIKYYY